MSTSSTHTHYAVGRRKTAAARVRFYQDPSRDGQIEVNGKAADQYFSLNNAAVALGALTTLSQPVGGYFTAKVSGGGAHSQAEAVRHGITRILLTLIPDSKKVLKGKGFVRRDPRMKERKKPGLRRARRAPQWSKR